MTEKPCCVPLVSSCSEVFYVFISKMNGNLLESEYIIRSAVDTTEKINYFKSQKYSRRLRAKVIQYLKKVMYGCKGQSIATH